VRDRCRLQRCASFRFAHTGAVTSVVGWPGVIELPQSDRRVTFRCINPRRCDRISQIW
jgi:hypothetical protein